MAPFHLQCIICAVRQSSAQQTINHKPFRSQVGVWTSLARRQVATRLFSPPLGTRVATATAERHRDTTRHATVTRIPLRASALLSGPIGWLFWSAEIFRLARQTPQSYSDSVTLIMISPSLQARQPQQFLLLSFRLVNSHERGPHNRCHPSHLSLPVPSADGRVLQ